MKLNGDRNQCMVCKEYFNSTYAFDKHRTGQYGNFGSNFGRNFGRRCFSPEEMVKMGMEKNSDGFWVTSRSKHTVCRSSIDA